MTFMTLTWILIGLWGPPLQIGTQTVHHSGRPLSQYRDGSGWSNRIEVDASWSNRWITVRLNPLWVAQENASIPVIPLEMFSAAQVRAYRNRHLTIDLPERYGRNNIHRFEPNHSGVELKAGWLRAAYTYAGEGWGAGERQQLMLSDHVSSYGHGRIELEDVPVGIGAASVTWIGGFVDSSGYARIPIPEDDRWLTGLYVRYKPWFDRNLELGFTRLFMLNDRDLKSWDDYVPILQPFQKINLGTGSDGFGSAPDNQIASIHFRWRFPESGLRVYGEFGREDHNSDVRDATIQPDHNRAYLWGFLKSGSTSEYGFEAVTLTQTNTRKLRSSDAWYVHTKVRHGHTHLGQVLGAEIGPGSRSQEVWWESDRARLSLRRVDVDKDLYHAAFTGLGYRPEVDWILRAGRDWSTERWIWSVDASWRHTRNRFYIQGKHESSLGLGFGARYRIR